MTVLIGILCEDGVVIGADSSATFAAGNFSTVEQPTSKLHVIAGTFLSAGTGSVGMNQRFEYVLQQIRAQSGFLNHDHMQIALNISVNARQNFGSTGCDSPFAAVVAFFCKGKPYLCEFSEGMQPEFKSDDLWFVSMGSGQPIADPFLGLLSRVFFKRKKPTVSEGIFATYWTLKHAIDLNPGGIQGPAAIGVLSSDLPGKAMLPRLLDDTQLQEHAGNIDAAEEHIAKYREALSGRFQSSCDTTTTTTPPPTPPTIP